MTPRLPLPAPIYDAIWANDLVRTVQTALNDLFDQANVRAVYFRPGRGAKVIWTSGSGTPEGVVTAPVGSLYTREDGGAGTTLYVKESGTGNTGWIAK